jgi:uncharacterized protein YjiS (DUF1127 family)
MFRVPPPGKNAMEHAMTHAIGVLKIGSASWTFGRFLRAALVPFERLQRNLRNRREAAILAAFDERALADIGLTRADVRFAFGEPVWRDPTKSLARCAGERRRRHPAAMIEAARVDGFRAPAPARPARDLV